MENKNKIRVYGILYFVLYIVAVLPLFCTDISQRGDSAMWSARVDEFIGALQSGRLLLFPSAETVVAYAGQYHGLDTNLWLLLPALLKMATGDTVLMYRMCGLLMQAGTLLAVICFSRKIWKEEQKAFFVTLFYMTAPYRWYLAYDSVNWARCIGFMLLPLFAQTVIAVYTEKGKRKWIALTAGAFAWAGIAYADWVLALILLGITAFSVVWYRNWSALLLLLAGGILYLPGLRYVARYLIKGVMEQWNFPLDSIMSEGYGIGAFLTAFAYRGELPGLGLGLLCAMLILIGMRFAKENFSWNRKYNFTLVLTIVLMVASCSFFPWDYVQRLGMPFVRMVALWESPAVFFGCAALPLSVLGAYTMESLPEEEVCGKIGKVMVAAACVGVSVYMCCRL